MHVWCDRFEASAIHTLKYAKESNALFSMLMSSSSPQEESPAAVMMDLSSSASAAAATVADNDTDTARLAHLSHVLRVHVFKALDDVHLNINALEQRIIVRQDLLRELEYYLKKVCHIDTCPTDCRVT